MAAVGIAPTRVAVTALVAIPATIALIGLCLAALIALLYSAAVTYMLMH